MLINSKNYIIIWSFFVISVFGVYFSHAQPAPVPVIKRFINETQARNYITHVIGSLFMPSMHERVYIQELNDFTRYVTQELLATQGIFDKAKNSKRYQALELCDELLGYIQAFIEQKSRKYIQQELMLLSLPKDADKVGIIERVVTRVKQQAHDIIEYADPFPAGALMHYMGSSLRTKIKVLLDRELAQTSRRDTHVNSLKRAV